MFGPSFNDYERRFYEQRCIQFVAQFGMPEAEAKKAAKQELTDAIAESKAAGWYGLGPVGGEVLKRYKSEPQFEKQWEAMTAAGVRDEDVVEWWNLPDFERRLMLRTDDVARASVFLDLLNQGKPDQEAGRLVWKAFPVCGDPTAPPTFADDPKSTMLPVEMKLRYIRWAERAQASGDWEGVKKELEAYGTMNEYVRWLARQGRL